MLTGPWRSERLNRKWRRRSGASSFAQLHRWLRQGYQVHVFCNNEGERERFREIWAEYGLGETMQNDRHQGWRTGRRMRAGAMDARLSTQLGVLARGFFYDPAKAVVVTDAGDFRAVQVQRPRRLKSPHALRGPLGFGH